MEGDRHAVFFLIIVEAKFVEFGIVATSQGPRLVVVVVVHF